MKKGACLGEMGGGRIKGQTGSTDGHSVMMGQTDRKVDLDTQVGKQNTMPS